MARHGDSRHAATGGTHGVVRCEALRPIVPSVARTADAKAAIRSKREKAVDMNESPGATRDALRRATALAPSKGPVNS